MFERFEEEAVRAILAARDDACRLGHPAVGSEHLVVGLARTDALTAQLVVAGGSAPDRLYETLASWPGEPDEFPTTDIPFSAEAQRAIARAWAVAEEFHHGTIAPAHLLLAVLRGSESGIPAMLALSGLDAGQLAESVEKALAPASKPRVRAGFQEDDLEVSTPYGPVTLTLLRRPEGSPDTARVISLSADTLAGPDEIRSFLSELDRLLDSAAGGLGVSFLRDLFGGLGRRLASYLEPSP